MKRDKPKDDEVICNRCNGTGITSTIQDENHSMSELCEFCRGKGFINWIDNILGPRVPNRVTNLTFKSFITNVLPDSQIVDFQQEIIKRISEDMVIKIDQEILDSLIKGINK